MKKQYLFLCLLFVVGSLMVEANVQISQMNFASSSISLGDKDQLKDLEQKKASLEEQITTTSDTNAKMRLQRELSKVNAQIAQIQLKASPSMKIEAVDFSNKTDKTGDDPYVGELKKELLNAEPVQVEYNIKNKVFKTQFAEPKMIEGNEASSENEIGNKLSVKESIEKAEETLQDSNASAADKAKATQMI